MDNMTNKKHLKLISRKTTQIEGKVSNYKKGMKRAFTGILAVVALMLILCAAIAYTVTRFNQWSLKNEIVWQAPIILQTPVYIKEVKPVVKKVKIVVTPTPTPEPRTEKEVVLAQKHGEVLWKVYGLESTWGKADGCRNKGKGYAGFGVMVEGKVVCYESFEKSAERASYWIGKLGVGQDLVNGLCKWNLGTANAPYANCNYYQEYLKI